MFLLCWPVALGRGLLGGTESSSGIAESPLCLQELRLGVAKAFRMRPTPKGFLIFLYVLLESI